MSAYQFKCRDCGAEFDEPYSWVERHGFNEGPGERWSACPCCESCDYDFSDVVEAEEEEEDDNED